MSKAHKHELLVQALTLTPIPEQVPNSISNMVKQLPNLVSKGTSTYPGSQHRIQLCADARLVPVKMRPIPYVIHEKVADAIRLLDEQGIWEPAEKGDWAHST